LARYVTENRRQGRGLPAGPDAGFKIAVDAAALGQRHGRDVKAGNETGRPYIRPIFIKALFGLAAA
jgi:hypothetical protein